MRVECKNPDQVVRRMFWLAWQACGSPLGMGFLQDNPGATEEQVWNAVYNQTDYPGGNAFGSNKPNEVYGDYVFGRMMKVGFRWDETGIELSDSTPQPDYQSWCRKYQTYRALYDAAVESLK